MKQVSKKNFKSFLALNERILKAIEQEEEPDFLDLYAFMELSHLLGLEA